MFESTQKKREAQMCQKECCLYLMCFSETTEPIGTKLGGNIYLIVL
jgi:hypothetical protein